MIASYQPKLEKKPYYRTEQIIPYLEEMQKDVEVSEIVTGQKVVVLFSGDSGFYSGAASMYRALREEISAGRLQASVRILSGISSVAYLAALHRRKLSGRGCLQYAWKRVVEFSRADTKQRKDLFINVRRIGRTKTWRNFRSCRT